MRNISTHDLSGVSFTGVSNYNTVLETRLGSTQDKNTFNLTNRRIYGFFFIRSVLFGGRTVMQNLKHIYMHNRASTSVLLQLFVAYLN